MKSDSLQSNTIRFGYKTKTKHAKCNFYSNEQNLKNNYIHEKFKIISKQIAFDTHVRNCNC